MNGLLLMILDSVVSQQQRDQLDYQLTLILCSTLWKTEEKSEGTLKELYFFF